MFFRWSVLTHDGKKYQLSSTSYTLTRTSMHTFENNFSQRHSKTHWVDVSSIYFDISVFDHACQPRTVTSSTSSAHPNPFINVCWDLRCNDAYLAHYWRMQRVWSGLQTPSSTLSWMQKNCTNDLHKCTCDSRVKPREQQHIQKLSLTLCSRVSIAWDQRCVFSLSRSVVLCCGCDFRGLTRSAKPDRDAKIHTYTYTTDQPRVCPTDTHMRAHGIGSYSISHTQTSTSIQRNRTCVWVHRLWQQDFHDQKIKKYFPQVQFCYHLLSVISLQTR